MAALFARADLAISRAGAGTLVELAITGTPSILIPYPYAAEDHQTYNARAFDNAGAGQLYPQTELSGEILGTLVTYILNDPQKRAAMSLAAKRLATTDSAAQMSELIGQQLRAG